MATEATHYRFSVHDYHQMAEAAILTEDDRVELIDGEIIEMSPIGAPHANCIVWLNRFLVTYFGKNGDVHVQNPLRVSEYDEPQPDITVVRPGLPRDELPQPRGVILLIEVSDTTLRYDRNVKLPLYAGAEVPECWIVDLQGEKIERYTDPVEGAFRTVAIVERGGKIQSATAPGLVLDVDDVLG